VIIALDTAFRHSTYLLQRHKYIDRLKWSMKSVKASKKSDPARAQCEDLHEDCHDLALAEACHDIPAVQENCCTSCRRF